MDDSDLISKSSDSEIIDSDDSDSENIDNKKIIKKTIILEKSDDEKSDIEKSDDEKSDVSINDNLDILSELNQTDSEEELSDLDDDTPSNLDSSIIDEKDHIINKLNDKLEIDSTYYTNIHSLSLKENKHKIELTGSDRITKPYFTKYELCRLISIRLNQLSQGMITPIDDTNLTINQIVRKEFLEKRIPLYIKREVSNNYYEKWYFNELKIKEKYYNLLEI